MKNTRDLSAVKESLGILIILFIWAYIGRPYDLPSGEKISLLRLTGMPSFSHSPPTKSSGSSDYFYVAGIKLYCGVGVVGGEENCIYLHELIDIKEKVTVVYFLMPNRIGFTYPIVLSIEQDGVVKVSPKLTNSELVRSTKLAWKNYYFGLGLFGFITVFIFIGKVALRSRKG